MDETTRGYGLGGETTRGEMVFGAKRLRVKNRGEMTRGESTGGGGGGGDVLGAKRFVTAIITRSSGRNKCKGIVTDE